MKLNKTTNLLICHPSPSLTDCLKRVISLNYSSIDGFISYMTVCNKRKKRFRERKFRESSKSEKPEADLGLLQHPRSSTL